MALNAERLKNNILKRLEENCGYILTGYTKCFIKSLSEEIVKEIKDNGECYNIVDRHGDNLKGEVR